MHFQNTKTLKNTILQSFTAFLLAFLTGTPVDLSAQAQRSISMPHVMWLDPSTDDFETIQQQVESYFEDRFRGRGSGYKQWKRWEYFNERRLDSLGRLQNVAQRTMEAYQEHQMIFENGSRTTTFGGFWSQIGPTTYTTGNSGYNGGLGRCNVIAFHPTNSSIIYAGMPSGGLWKSTNTGNSWTCLTDGMPVIGVSGIAVHNSNPNIIYILTGDGDAEDTRSIGVLKTTDGGDTWHSTGLTYDITDDVRGYKLLMHPTNSSILFAAMIDGLWKTTDGGVTWTRVVNDSFRDIEFKPDDASTVYAVTNNNYYRSTDGGDNFIESTSSAGLPTSGVQRFALGVTPDQSNYVYVVAGPGGSSGNGTFRGFYRSFDSGQNFDFKTGAPNILGGSLNGGGDGNQSWYDLAIAVSPVDEADILVGGINIWRSDTYGNNGSWSIIAHWNSNTASNNGLEYTHADIHELVFNPNDNSLWCGSDGGVFRSTDYGLTWTDKSSGICIMQFYKIAGWELNSDLLIGGTQDNGSNRWTGGTDITHFDGADGMDCAIDIANPLIQYHMRQNGQLRKSLNGGQSHFYIAPDTTGPWVTPLLMDPNNSSIIYVGNTDVYRSTNGGSSWSNRGWNGSDAMAMSQHNSSVIYAANGSTLKRSDNSGSSWTTISGGLPSNTITGITVDPQNANQVWISMGGYNANEKVYLTYNAAATTVSWTNLTGNIPNTVVNCIQIEDGPVDDAIYIGTDIGVYYRDPGLGEWIPFRNGLPTVPVFDLEINETDELIRAGTYGRGLWSSNTYGDCPTGWYLTVGNDPSNPNYTGVQYYESSGYITSSRIITGGVGTDVTYRAADYINLTTDFTVEYGNLFTAELGNCTGSAPAPLIKLKGTYAGPMPELQPESD